MHLLEGTKKNHIRTCEDNGCWVKNETDLPNMEQDYSEKKQIKQELNTI